MSAAPILDRLSGRDVNAAKVSRALASQAERRGDLELAQAHEARAQEYERRALELRTCSQAFEPEVEYNKPFAVDSVALGEERFEQSFSGGVEAFYRARAEKRSRARRGWIALAIGAGLALFALAALAGCGPSVNEAQGYGVRWAAIECDWLGTCCRTWAADGREIGLRCARWWSPVSSGCREDPTCATTPAAPLPEKEGHR